MTRRNISRFILILSILLLSLFGYMEYKVISSSGLYTPEKSDFIIILGNSLEDGDVPSLWLQKRLEAGIYLYDNSYADKIIVTGGKGRFDKTAVALSMKNWLIDNGIPADDIITDERSKNTYENFKFSKELVDELINVDEKGNIIVVTNDFHMYRSMIIADSFFDDTSGFNAPVVMSLRKVLAYLKEPLSLIKYYVLYYVSN